jgi:2-polyprenyl-6-methoxyphenol hydroxylase-like FAD-dependent oxidoreductase
MNSSKDQDLPVLIAGGGIGGLAVALTLHQIGVPFLVFEAVKELKPLGVGINLQPNAVRELYDLGITQEELDSIGVQTREWALVGLNGKDVYSEPRGIAAGYKWPQYSVHRGRLQMLLYHKVLERMGEDAIRTGHRVTAYANNNESVTATIITDKGNELRVKGSLLIAADGIHSALRQQFYPDQGPVNWGGAIMWRGTTPGIPIRTGASFVGLGTHHHRVVFYPISEPDAESIMAEINWIAEITVDNSDGWKDHNWNKKVATEDFIHHFENWDYDWINIQEMLSGAEEVYEYPMIDRDPVPSWVDGHIALLGDAAHAMYPTGSNGATQAIIDARVLGAAMLECGLNKAALDKYNEILCKDISAVILRNRGAGPFVLLNELDDRCGGVFENIEEVFPSAEREELMSNYKAAAGYAMEKLNAAPPTINENAKLTEKD